MSDFYTRFEIIEYGTPEYHQTIDLRTEVLRIPLGLEFTIEQLEAEYNAEHLGLFDENFSLLACLVLQEIDSKIVKMRQVAVHPDHQRKGLGRHLVEYSEAYAISKNYSWMVLHARDTAISFYEDLGYSTEGELFQEVGIDHYKMRKLL